jgi:hypothetical protein
MKWLYDLLGIPYCKKCGSIKLEYSSSWYGGWNYLCNQSIARAGTQCFNCGNIVWDQTDDEYEKTLPEWCKSERELKNK